MSTRPWKRRVILSASVALGLLVLTLVVVKLVYGLGRPYPDVNTTPVLAPEAAEAVVESDMPMGNVAVSPDGRVFYNVHPFAVSDRFRDSFVFELYPDGSSTPFPSQRLQPELRYVFGMTADAQGRLWFTSPATLERDRTRLMAIDLESGELVVDEQLDPGVARFGQDLRVSDDGRFIFLADTGAFRFTPASLLVLDLEDWSVRTVLEGHPSTSPQKWLIRTSQGPHRIAGGLLTFVVGVDGIALDDGWLYYATMSHDTLYRVPVPRLTDPTSSEADIEDSVEVVAHKPLSDGIEVDAAGRVIVTDIEHGGLVRISPANGELETLVLRDDVVWADGVSVAPNGDIYFTDSAIPRYLHPLLRPPTEQALLEGGPYRLYRIKNPS